MSIRDDDNLNNEIDDLDEFNDETLLERITALSEMFPQSVRSAAVSSAMASLKGLATVYTFSRQALWITSTSFVILWLPIVFETERYMAANHHIGKDGKTLLGPTAGPMLTSTSGIAGLPPLSA